MGWGGVYLPGVLTQTLDRAWQDLKKYVPSEITAKDATSKKVNPALGDWIYSWMLRRNCKGDVWAAMPALFHRDRDCCKPAAKTSSAANGGVTTLPAFFDMCQAGGLRTPNSEFFLQKRTQVWTTSREMHKMLHRRNCPKNHEHQPIKGNVTGKDQKWIRLSAYAAAHTAVFARRVARTILRMSQESEKPLLLEELMVGEDIEILGGAPKRPLAQNILELRKCRRRRDGKGPPTAADKSANLGPKEGKGDVGAWKGVVALFEKGVPRVGNSLCWVGDPKIERLQQLVPKVDVQLFITCRGTERHRVPGIQIRLAGKIFHCGKLYISEPLEKLWTWETLKNGENCPKQNKHGKLAVCHKSSRDWGGGVVSFDLRNGEERAVVRNQGQINPTSPEDPLIPNSADGAVQPPQLEMGKGWPPKIVPGHGPAFLRLDPDRTSDLLRLHHNLGHQDPSRLQRLLEAQVPIRKS